MNTGKKTIILFIFILVYITSYGQQTEYYSDILKDIRIAKELFNNSKYNASIRHFEKIQGKVDEGSEIYSEAEYYKAWAAVKSDKNNGDKMMDNFIENYPESPYYNKAKFNLSVAQFDNRRYLPAIRNMEQVDIGELTQEEQVLFHYQMGYSYLMTDNLDRAAQEFYKIINENNLYSKPASYYWAHINYLNENYESALQGFSNLNNDPTFSQVIPLYVSHIYYKQQKYREVIDYIVPIIDQVDASHKSELSKIVGDSYFHLDQYQEAIPFLETYHKSQGLKSREDNYLLGYCYYYTAQFSNAIPYLEKASKGDDELAQNAYYHLADCYIKNEDKEKARIAFEAASELDFDEKIKEDALFNYAKITYELSYSPFNETIKAFDKYISQYPNSERNNIAYQYLVQVYMVTHNYEDAIQSIEKIQVKNASINHAYQRVTFYRGLELFNNQLYNQAIDNFNKSLENSSSDRSLKARATYWKAEAQYRLEDYNSAINTYNDFLVTPGAFSLPEFRDSQYNLAYAYFKLNNYSSANSMFREFINAQQDRRSEKIADALNRVGDCYFLQRNYTTAVRYYDDSYRLNLFDPDYSLFQIAFCRGLERNQQEKITLLRRLLNDFRESAYRDDALYELGRANEQINQESEAIRQYTEIITDFKNSSYYRKALLQLGLINYNQGNFNQSIDYYKQIIENYPNSEEAKSALTGLRNNYIEQNNVNEYFSYVENRGTGTTVTASEQDSLIYLAAERQFMSGDENVVTQFQRYLDQFPYGGYVLNAHFYLAEALYNNGRYTEALEHYDYVASQPDNIFSETALLKASELYFNANNYNKALEFYSRLADISNNKWNNLSAYAGIMRCNFNLGNYYEAVSAAENVKTSDKANEALIRNADYILAKSYYNLDNFLSALPSLKSLANDTKSEQGAEAKYLIAEIYFLQEDLETSENEIMDFISKGTPYQYWLGKGFILLSDIYALQNDDFQAKHTLRSVVENYGNPDDGIIAEASQKLAIIEARERAEQENAVSQPMEININNQ